MKTTTKKSLLVITQAVDETDSNLGFFCDWITALSKQLGHVYVIANRVGAFTMPDNVTVFSLRKEKGVGRLARLIRFWILLARCLPKIRGVFVHMCPEYVIGGAWIARLFGKKLGLWYLHKSIPWQLRFAEKIVDHIFTAHKDGVALNSKKIIVTGHGIFLPPSSIHSTVHYSHKQRVLRLLTVGRITKSKDLLTIVKAAILLRQDWPTPVHLVIIGAPYLEKDNAYFFEVQAYIKDHRAQDIVEFSGTVHHKNLARLYANADVFLNASTTGGVDKAVLEALFMGVPVITSNSAFRHILPPECLFSPLQVKEAVEKIKKYRDIPIRGISERIHQDHNLDRTISTILSYVCP